MAERLQPALDRTSAVSTEGLRLVAAFLTPAALSFGILGFWRLGADLGVFGEFFLEDGTFSHWQVWCALALGAQAGSIALNRRLKRQDAAQQRTD